MTPQMWAQKWQAAQYAAEAVAPQAGDLIQIDRDWDGPSFIKGGLSVQAADVVTVVQVRPDGYIVARFGREEGLLGGSGCFARVLLSVPLGPQLDGPLGTNGDTRASQRRSAPPPAPPVASLTFVKASAPGPPAKRHRAENPSESSAAPQPRAPGPVVRQPTPEQFLAAEPPPPIPPGAAGMPGMPAMPAMQGMPAPILPPAMPPAMPGKGGSKGGKGDVPCRRWMRGHCQFGDKCNFSHLGATPQPQAARPPPPMDNLEKIEKTQAGQEWPNDWLCECGVRNFERRSECFKCHAARPEVPGEKPHLPPMDSETFEECYARMINEGPGSLDAPTLQSMEIYLTRDFKVNGPGRSQWQGGNSFDVWDENVESCLSRINRVKLFRLYELSPALYGDFMVMIPGGNFKKFDSYVGMALSQHIDLAGFEISDEELDRRVELKETGVKLEATVCQWGLRCRDLHNCTLVHVVEKNQSS